MKVIIDEETQIKFFKWVILSKTIVKNHQVIENEPIYLTNREYFEKEFNKSN